MMQRCHNPASDRYDNYGGRGITVCPEWHDVAVFIDWIEENLGPKSEGMSIDRWPDNDGPYAPGNVRWATDAEQMRNTRRSRLLSLNGVTQCVADWAEETGISRYTIHDRLKNGWTAEQALTTTMHEQQVGYKLLTLHGVTKSQAEWARDLGIPAGTIGSRLRQGWTAERALTTAVPVQGGAKVLTFRGVTRSIAEWAEDLGIYEQTLMGRLRRGLPIEKVLTGAGCQPPEREQAR